MAVNIDPSEVRKGTSPVQASPATLRLALPNRTILASAIGGVALIAFTIGAFSFFSDLADPRARKSRPMPAAASMPDLKDGMPALVDGGSFDPAPKASTFNLPRPDSIEQPAQEQPPVQQAAAPAQVTAPAQVAAPAQVTAPAQVAAPAQPAAPAVERPPVAQVAVSSDRQPAEPRKGATPLPIQNAATVPEARTVATVAAPARPVATIAPARAETVKAKPVQPSAVAAHTPSQEAEAAPEPTSTATVTSPPAAQPAHKPVAAKQAAQKTASRKTPSAKQTADAEPAAASAPVASADDSDIPGARQFRAGVKAISGIFGGDSKDD